MSSSKPVGDAVSVCFVCTGNICRSPMAEVVLSTLAARTNGRAPRLEVASAGTGPWHVGEPMDPRARRALEARGYEDRGHVARQFDPSWLEYLDLVVCCDRRHAETLRGLSGKEAGGALRLLRAYDPASGGALDIPDPYYGDERDFEACLDLVERACGGLLAELVAGGG